MRYRELLVRLTELRRHLLPFLPDPPVSSLTYSDAELDSTRAYVVLAHAEIEAFCEQISLAKATVSKAFFDTSQVVTPCLRRILSYHVANKKGSWHEVTNPQNLNADKAFRFYQKIIRENHGVKRKNLETILYPIGFIETELDPSWLAQMDSFGTIRGGWAHSSVRTQQPPTRSRSCRPFSNCSRVYWI
jgi:hypothetical protein